MDGIDKRRQDFEDLQNEIAGRTTGRQARFLPEGPGSEEAKRKEREARAFQNRLAELLSDPIYRAKYETVLEALSAAEQHVDAALAEIKAELSNAKDALEDIQDRAARLPDGTRVYRDTNGIVRNEDGEIVDDTLAATIVWTGNEPSYEEYLAARERIEALIQALEDLQGYRNDVLGDARDRLENPDNPPDLGELDQILSDIQDRMPDLEAKEQQAPDTAVVADADPTAIALPKLD